MNFQRDQFLKYSNQAFDLHLHELMHCAAATQLADNCINKQVYPLQWTVGVWL